MGFNMICSLFSTFFSMTVAQYAFNDLFDINENDINSHMELLAEQVWDKSFRGRTCVLLWSENDMMEHFNPKSQPSVIRLITAPGKSCDNSSLGQLRAAFDHNCNIYIVQISDPSCFFEMWDEAGEMIAPRHNPKLFFLPVYPDSTVYGESLLALPITEISADILVAELELSDQWQVKLSTNNFAERVGTANRTGRIPLDEWSPHLGFKNNVYLYPNKLKDMKGKEIILATLQYLPHMNLEPLEGIEANIFTEYCKKYNCTIKISVDDDKWGKITGKKQGIGVLGKISKGEADFGAISFGMFSEFYYHLDFSTPYMQSSVVLLVPKGVMLSAWRTPFLPFGLVLWISIFFCWVISSLGLYAFTVLTIKYTRFGNEIKNRELFTSFTDSVVRSFGIAVLQQPSNLFPNSPVRHLFTSFEFLYLILTACYSAELASYLTSPQYTKPIDTYQELAHSGLIWLADNYAWSYGFSDRPEDKAVLNNFRVIPQPEIRTVALTGKYGLAIEGLVEGHYGELDHVTEEVIAKLHPMTEHLQEGQLTTLLVKGSPYKDSLNHHILLLLDGGMFKYWENTLAGVLLDNRRQMALMFAKKDQKGTEEPKILTVGHIQGAFFLYTIGVVISFGVLIFEIQENKKLTIHKKY